MHVRGLLGVVIALFGCGDGTDPPTPAAGTEATGSDASDGTGTQAAPVDLPNLPGAVVEIDFIQLGESPSSSARDAYATALDDLASVYGGELSGDVLRVADPTIDNPGLPAVTSPLVADVVTVVWLPSVDDAEAFLSDPFRDDIVTQFGGVPERRQRVVATIIGFPPGFPPLPPLGQVATKAAPAFWHFNALDSIDGTDDQLVEFYGMAAPMVAGSGANFSAILSNAVVLDGEFPYERFTFTQWPDQAAFDALHEDPTFLEDVAPIRNGTLEGFIEARVLAPSQEQQ